MNVRPRKRERAKDSPSTQRSLAEYGDVLRIRVVNQLLVPIETQRNDQKRRPVIKYAFYYPELNFETLFLSSNLPLAELSKTSSFVGSKSTVVRHPSLQWSSHMQGISLLVSQ